MQVRARLAVAASAAAVVMLGFAGPSLAQDDPQPWIHVEVIGEGDEADENGEVRINLPLVVAEVLVSMIPAEGLGDGEIQLADTGIAVSIPALRKTWRQLMDAGDMRFVSVETGDGNLRVARAGDDIEVWMVRAGDEAGSGEMRLPVAVVDALFSGADDTLDFGAAVAELSTFRGDLVRMRADDRRIRVWIDETPEP